MATALPTLNSPKRKRGSSDSDFYSPSTSPQSTVSLSNIQEARLGEEENLGRYSPRAAVAGRLGELAIHGDHLSKFEAQSNNLNQESVALTARATCLPSPLGGANFDMSKTIIVPSIEGSANPDEALPNGAKEEPTTPTTSPKKKKPTPSPRKRQNSNPQAKLRKPRLSPPLTSSDVEDPFTWHDSEITGHNPTDPSDDGYGINGIGFKPTPALAWARSEKRRKQVADWRNREAREAREKRREKRDGADPDKMRTVQTGAIQKKVKFDV